MQYDSTTSAWLAVLLLLLSPLALAGGIERISDDGFANAGNCHSGTARPAVNHISSNGRYVAYASCANNLVIPDANGTIYDIYVYDGDTSINERVSVASDGTQGNRDSVEPTISADGRFVAFYSRATNLVSPDANFAHYDIFVHDRDTGVTELLSVASDGLQANFSSFSPSISADGRYVAFYSQATNLVTPDTNGTRYDIFVHDRDTGVTERVSVATDGSQANNNSFLPTISADGRYVAFFSHATNLVTTDANFGYFDIFVHDRDSGVTELVSVASDGIQANFNSHSPSISADGRYVAFYSQATNLVTPDANGTRYDVFVHDRDTGVTERASVASNGTQGNLYSAHPSISADGRYVAFYSQATNLVTPDANGFALDVYVHDRTTGGTIRVNNAGDGTQADSTSYLGAISPDGTLVAFQSNATNLAPNANGYWQAFLKETGLEASGLNRPPIADAQGSYSVPEGSSVQLTGAGTDPDDDPIIFDWDLDGLPGFETPAQNPIFSAADLDGPDSIVVTLQVTDYGGLNSTSSTTVEISNVAPTLGTITAPVDPAPVGSLIQFEVAFTDPGKPDTHEGLWNFGDSNQCDTATDNLCQVDENLGSGITSAEHLYSEAGVYTLSVTLTDDDGGSDVEDLRYVVVYDPDGGFVTGGGHILSPPGAMPSDPDATGSARFGFVSKYLRGASTPSGSTEFQFQAGDINFHSNSYEWLVIANHKAQYKGTGTINQSGNFGFMLTAIDERLTPSTDADRFRIKIWDKDNGDIVVYDNQLGAPDDSDATNALTAGSIVIHTNGN